MAMDLARCEELAARAAAGDQHARQALIEVLWPEWVSMISSSRRMASFVRSEDHARNVATRLLEKFQKGDGHVLVQYRLWRERHVGKTFGDWMSIVVANAERNYVASQLGPVPASEGAPSPKRVLNEFASSAFLEEVGVEPGQTAAQTARELLEFAETHLPADQCSALGLWLSGCDTEEIARAMKLTSSEANRLQRAAVAALRREFGHGTGRD